MPVRLSARQARALTGRRTPKYFNKKVVVDGLTFDSQHEAAHYGRLVQLERIGAVRQLRRQVRFPLVVNGVKVSTLRLDFVYEERRDGAWQLVHEDTKSKATAANRAWQLRKRLFRALYGYEIREVIARRR